MKYVDVNSNIDWVGREVWKDNNKSGKQPYFHRDYPRKLLRWAISYAWERAANASQVHEKLWAPWQGSEVRPIGEALETMIF